MTKRLVSAVGTSSAACPRRGGRVLCVHGDGSVHAPSRHLTPISTAVTTTQKGTCKMVGSPPLVCGCPRLSGRTPSLSISRRSSSAWACWSSTMSGERRCGAVLERPPVRQIRRDPRRPKRVAAGRERQTRGRRAPLDHRQNETPRQRPARQSAAGSTLWNSAAFASSSSAASR